MALSSVATLNQIASLLRSVTGMAAVYSQGSADSNAIPMALSAFPCATVEAGEGTYMLGQGQHRHTYQVVATVFTAGEDVGMSQAEVLPFLEACLEKMSVNVTLGGLANSAIGLRHSRIGGLEYANGAYSGFQIFFEVSEQASATPAPGS